MPDLLDKAHVDAVLALLAAGLDPAIVVYDGVVPSPYPDPEVHPYVVVYFSGGWPTDGAGNAFDGRSATYRMQCYTHSVGGTAAACRAVAGQVRAALLNVRPAISGRSVFPIRWDDGQPAGTDESLGFPVINKADVYELKTTG
jgi:hypothetical protein